MPEPFGSRGCSHTLVRHRAERKAARKASKQSLTRRFPSRERGGCSLLPDACFSGTDRFCFPRGSTGPPFAVCGAIGSFPCRGPVAWLLVGLPAMLPLPIHKGRLQGPGFRHGLCSTWHDEVLAREQTSRALTATVMVGSASLRRGLESPKQQPHQRVQCLHPHGEPCSGGCFGPAPRVCQPRWGARSRLAQWLESEELLRKWSK